MDHYYTPDPASAHKRGEVTLELPGKPLSFMTDAGVFSRGRVDEGTQLLLDTLLAQTPPLTGRVLDLGCGVGILGLGLAAALPAVSPALVDVNRRALELSRENAARLGIPAQVTESDGFSAVAGLFDHIVTNPPIRAGKAVYYPWFAQAPAFLAPGGCFWCVVQKKQGAASVKAALKASFGHCERAAHRAGYHVLRACRPPAKAP